MVWNSFVFGRVVVDGVQIDFSWYGICGLLSDLFLDGNVLKELQFYDEVIIEKNFLKLRKFMVFGLK